MVVKEKDVKTNRKKTVPEQTLAIRGILEAG
jgi:hypothetical protein